MVEDTRISDTVERVRLNLVESGGRTIGDFGRDVVAGTEGGAEILVFGVIDFSKVTNWALMLVGFFFLFLFFLSFFSLFFFFFPLSLSSGMLLTSRVGIVRLPSWSLSYTQQARASQMLHSSQWFRRNRSR